jgi:hypothetical protein
MHRVIIAFMQNINDHEFSIYSQNGEDGIIAFLTGGLKQNRKRFVEIGTADGGENNSLYLLKLGWTGLGVDVDPENIRRYMSRIANKPFAQRLTLALMKVGWDNCQWIVDEYGDKNPDFFSLDIDSVDYYIAYRMLQLGWRPSVVCCEYNAFLGKEPVTVMYEANFSRRHLDPQRGLYFGVSVAAWRYLFSQYGYKFCGTDSAGVNVFFCLPEAFNAGFLDEISGPEHTYTKVFVDKYRMSGEDLERELLAREDLVFVNVTEESVEDIVADCDRPPEDGPQIFTSSKSSTSHVKPLAGTATSIPVPKKMPVIHAAATFHAEGYERFGKEFIESFRRHWPKETKLWIFAEGCKPEGCDRVIVRDLHEDAHDLVEFKQRHAANPGAHGHFGETYQYMLDSVRWSHRIFALREAALRSDADILVNIDADIVCFQDLPIEFLATLMPESADIGFMPRKNIYSECSFVLYNLRNPAVRQFIVDHTNYYTHDKIFTLKRWTDCHAFDTMVAEHRKLSDLQFYNINEGVPDSMHPFVNGPLGRYMDHLKGGRKEEGRSSEKDLVVERTEAYWTKARVAG